jgi:hypothetical protein
VCREIWQVNDIFCEIRMCNCDLPKITYKDPDELNCWVLHPVARVSINVFLKTTVRNNVFVLDFIVHY